MTIPSSFRRSIAAHRVVAVAVFVASIACAADASPPAAVDRQRPVTAPAARGAAPIFGVTIPAGYRQWELVAVSQEVGFEEFRGIVGNSAAIRAYRDGTLPFPDGAMLVKIAWKRVPSTESDGAFVPGAPTTVQVMVKDSKRYAATGGWGFGRFVAGDPVDEAQHRTCFACHVAKVKDHDIVFTRFAP